MSPALWTAVDDLVTERLLPADPALDEVLRHSRHEGLPDIAVSPAQGAFLSLLARIAGARRVLEVGTLGGYSTVWLARAVGDGGEVVTLEIDPHHAEVARANLATAGVADRVQVLVGAARDTLAGLSGPFDLVFVDADKPGNPDYVRAALEMSRPGTVVVVDNVVRGGAVADLDDDSPSVVGSRAVMDLVAADDRLEATVLQTVGAKGHDGFLLARVVPGVSG